MANEPRYGTAFQIEQEGVQPLGLGGSPRVVELVNELVGAQAMGRMVTEAVAGLTPEQRLEISNAIFSKAMAWLNGVGSWREGNADKLCASLCESLVRPGLEADEALRARLVADARTLMEGRWKTAVEDVAKVAMDRAVALVKTTIRDWR